MGLLSTSIESGEHAGNLDELDRALGLSSTNIPDDKSKKVYLLLNCIDKKKKERINVF
jgi:hypothetical protein